jgi:imidazoleglycerol-phosphate dehydratase
MRRTKIERKTTETEILVEVLLEGKGEADINTKIPFLNHILTLFSLHSLFNLKIEAEGDLSHHIIEDVGIALGDALSRALGDRSRIKRYGWAAIPMDESLVAVAVDISRRPHLSLYGNLHLLPFEGDSFSALSLSGTIDGFDVRLVEDFLIAFTNRAAFALHILFMYGKDLHHLMEAAFKGLGRALSASVEIDPRIDHIPSTKGVL